MSQCWKVAMAEERKSENGNWGLVGSRGTDFNRDWCRDPRERVSQEQDARRMEIKKINRSRGRACLKCSRTATGERALYLAYSKKWTYRSGSPLECSLLSLGPHSL
jgi:hypothetical protein